MNSTKNLGLNLPEEDDFFHWNQLNENMEKVDKLAAPEFDIAKKIENLQSGERYETLFSKIAKAVKEFISHIDDKKVHITQEERIEWDNAVKNIKANLLKLTLENADVNGAKLLKRKNGIYTLSGTCSNSAAKVISSTASAEIINSVKGKEVTISLNSNDEKVTMWFKMHKGAGNTVITEDFEVKDNLTITLPEQLLGITAILRFDAGTYQNVLIAPRLELRQQTYAAPYTGTNENLASNVADILSNVEKMQDTKLDKNRIVNSLVTTEEGYALDARQGEALDGKITELKKSVSDGKSAIASAITNEGVSTASDASFETMVENIGKIFYKRLGTQLPKCYYANVHATSGSQSHQYIYRNANTTTKDDWLGHEEFFGGSLPALNGCIIITWLRGIGAFTIMRLKSSFLGVDNFETLYSNALHYYHPDGGTINLVSTEIKPGVEICTLCLACHS